MIIIIITIITTTTTTTTTTTATLLLLLLLLLLRDNILTHGIHGTSSRILVYIKCVTVPILLDWGLARDVSLEHHSQPDPTQPINCAEVHQRHARSSFAVTQDVPATCRSQRAQIPLN